MEIVDTHCHIHGSQLRSGGGGEAVTRALWQKAGFPAGDDIIARAAEHDVTKMICVGCSLPDSELAVQFVQGRPQCWASIGIHPHEAKDYVVARTRGETYKAQLDVAKLAQFSALASTTKVVAIGECGLDYFYEHSDPADQAAILKFQIELALAHDLPLIFHVRQAFDDFWPIFEACRAKSSKKIRGVLHSFTDSQQNLTKALVNGIFIGVNGIATFTKTEEQIAMYKAIPLSSLVLETDSPFLTPSPYRGNICEPYHTSVTAKFLAGLRNESLEQLTAATTVNAQTLFNL
jgi:TatD DNase family protein